MNLLALTSAQWIDLGISLIIVVLAAILGRWLITVILNRIVRRFFKSTKTMLDDVVFASTITPLYLVAIISAADFAISRLDFLPPNWAEPIGNIFYTLYFLIGFGAVWRLTVDLFKWYGDEVAPKTETELDEQLVPFFSRVSLIILAIVGLIIFLANFDVNVSALVTTLGVGSLAIALAAQAALADTISGFIIMIDRPFRIGDRIEIQDLNTWGDVIDIGLRSSKIRTRDNRMVIIPNSVIGKSLVVNYSYPNSQYRIQVHIGLAYGTDIEHARQIIIDAVRKVEGVLKDRPVEALFLEFAPSSMTFRVRWWLESYADTRRMFDSVNSAMYQALNDANIRIPFPQTDVHHKIDQQDEARLSALFSGK